MKYPRDPGVVDNDGHWLFFLMFILMALANLLVKSVVLMSLLLIVMIVLNVLAQSNVMKIRVDLDAFLKVNLIGLF